VYLYDAIDRSENRDVLQRLEESAAVVAERLQAIDYNALDISDYTKKYIRGYLRNIRGVLQIYTHLMYISMESCRFSNLNDYVFVDYGGGTGIMSLLALEFGFGTVLYVDIYDVSCRDAELIAVNVGGGADKYIVGGVDELTKFVNDSGISVDVVVSYDVIEHIYDINNYYAKMKMLNKDDMCIVCATSANMYNPIIHKARAAGHQQVEYQNRCQEWGHKERDSLQSYLSLRKEIISKFAPDLQSDIVDLIAKNTRGLYKGDIETCVDEYVKFGDFVYRPSHPTNTCDPLTGNWAERLMSVYFLKGVVEQNGFKFSILNGYYGHSSSKGKQFVKLLLDVFISLLGRSGIYLSPYFVVMAKSDKDSG